MYIDEVIPVEASVNVSGLPNSLELNWKDFAGCPSQLTSIILRLWPNGLVLPPKKRTGKELIKTSIFISRKPEIDFEPITYIIPNIDLSRRYSSSDDDKNPLFSINLSFFKAPYGGVKWQPLNNCRKYVLEIESLYSWTSTAGPKISQTIYTSTPQGN